ncbi:unnamed protein product [Thlaspi arvense]|uniref:Uncharacterized protein n=1 Tax=Thlaspi arvense TaxID=13288 RepID=A0AAU9S4Z8_THLAR|nr:unnamed protein product [Thlaspi arvense]
MPKPPPTISYPRPKLGFFWENPDLCRNCDGVSDLNIVEDRLERMHENVMASLEKEEKLKLGSDFDQNPNFSSRSNSSDIASSDQNSSHSSHHQIVCPQIATFDQSPSFSDEEIQGGSSNSSDQSCFLENNTMTLTQETTQTEPVMVNVGDCGHEQSFWDDLYNEDVFGFNKGFPLGQNKAQENTTNEEDDYMVEIRKFLNEEEIDFSQFTA